MERRLWVTTHGLYASGRLVGRWFELGDDEDRSILESTEELIAELIRIAADGEAVIAAHVIGDEPLVCDREGFPAECLTGESLPDALAWDALLTEHDEDTIAAILVAHGSAYYTPELLAEKLRTGDIPLIVWGRDQDDCADQFCEEFGILDEIPENLRYYFDCEAYVRDLILNGEATFAEVGGRTALVWGE